MLLRSVGLPLLWWAGVAEGLGWPTMYGRTDSSNRGFSFANTDLMNNVTEMCASPVLHVHGVPARETAFHVALAGGFGTSIVPCANGTDGGLNEFASCSAGVDEVALTRRGSSVTCDTRKWPIPGGSGEWSAVWGVRDGWVFGEAVKGLNEASREQLVGGKGIMLPLAVSVDYEPWSNTVFWGGAYLTGAVDVQDPRNPIQMRGLSGALLQQNVTKVAAAYMRGQRRLYMMNDLRESVPMRPWQTWGLDTDTYYTWEIRVPNMVGPHIKNYVVDLTADKYGATVLAATGEVQTEDAPLDAMVGQFGMAGMWKAPEQNFLCWWSPHMQQQSIGYTGIDEWNSGIRLPADVSFPFNPVAGEPFGFGPIVDVVGSQEAGALLVLQEEGLIITPHPVPSPEPLGTEAPHTQVPATPAPPTFAPAGSGEVSTPTPALYGAAEFAPRKTELPALGAGETRTNMCLLRTGYNSDVYHVVVGGTDGVHVVTVSNPYAGATGALPAGTLERGTLPGGSPTGGSVACNQDIPVFYALTEPSGVLGSYRVAETGALRVVGSSVTGMKDVDGLHFDPISHNVSWVRHAGLWEIGYVTPGTGELISWATYWGITWSPIKMMRYSPGHIALINDNTGVETSSLERRTWDATKYLPHEYTHRKISAGGPVVDLVMARSDSLVLLKTGLVKWGEAIMTNSATAFDVGAVVGCSGAGCEPVAIKTQGPNLAVVLFAFDSPPRSVVATLAMGVDATNTLTHVGNLTQLPDVRGVALEVTMKLLWVLASDGNLYAQTAAVDPAAHPRFPATPSPFYPTPRSLYDNPIVHDTSPLSSVNSNTNETTEVPEVTPTPTRAEEEGRETPAPFYTDHSLTHLEQDCKTGEWSESGAWFQHITRWGSEEESAHQGTHSHSGTVRAWPQLPESTFEDIPWVLGMRGVRGFVPDKTLAGGSKLGFHCPPGTGSKRHGSCWAYVFIHSATGKPRCEGEAALVRHLDETPGWVRDGCAPKFRVHEGGMSHPMHVYRHYLDERSSTSTGGLELVFPDDADTTFAFFGLSKGETDCSAIVNRRECAFSGCAVQPDGSCTLGHWCGYLSPFDEQHLSTRSRSS